MNARQAINNVIGCTREGEVLDGKGKDGKMERGTEIVLTRSVTA
jgi:hypothetical protein